MVHNLANQDKQKIAKGKKSASGVAAVQCNKNDLPGVIELADSVMRVGTDQTMLKDYPLVYLDRNLQNIFVVKLDGIIVAEIPFIPRHINFEGCQFNVGIICATATHPEHRRKGYARACLEDCVNKMDRDDIELSVLWTLVSTFPFYELCDYQAVRSQVFQYELDLLYDHNIFKDYGYDVSILQGSKAELDKIKQIHEKEIYGVHRSRVEYDYLFSLPKQKTLIARQNDQITAYLTVSMSCNKPGIVEGGGSIKGLKTLLHHTFRRHLPYWRHENPVPVYDYLTGSALGNVLKQTTPERVRPWPEHQMIRINHPRKFLEKIKQWLVRANNASKRSFSVELTDRNDIISFKFTKDDLVLGQEQCSSHCKMNARELTSVIFGEHPARRIEKPDVFNDLFPFYFPIWLLDHS